MCAFLFPATLFLGMSGEDGLQCVHVVRLRVTKVCQGNGCESQSVKTGQRKRNAVKESEIYIYIYIYTHTYGQGLAFCPRFRQKFALNWGESACLDQKNTTNLVRTFFLTSSPCFDSKWLNMLFMPFKKAKCRQQMRPPHIYIYIHTRPRFLPTFKA